MLAPRIRMTPVEAPGGDQKPLKDAENKDILGSKRKPRRAVSPCPQEVVCRLCEVCRGARSKTGGGQGWARWGGRQEQGGGWGGRSGGRVWAVI